MNNHIDGDGVFNPEPGKYLFDTEAIPDIALSDFVIGIIKHAYFIKIVKKSFFKKHLRTFNADGKVKQKATGRGHPFLDIHGEAITCGDVTLDAEDDNIATSIYSAETIERMDKYDLWWTRCTRASGAPFTPEEDVKTEPDLDSEVETNKKRKRNSGTNASSESNAASSSRSSAAVTSQPKTLSAALKVKDAKINLLECQLKAFEESNAEMQEKMEENLERSNRMVSLAFNSVLENLTSSARTAKEFIIRWDVDRVLAMQFRDTLRSQLRAVDKHIGIEFDTIDRLKEKVASLTSALNAEKRTDGSGEIGIASNDVTLPENNTKGKGVSDAHMEDLEETIDGLEGEYFENMESNPSSEIHG